MSESDLDVINVDIGHMRRAIEIALESEGRGNTAVGAVIVLGDSVIAEGASSIVVPEYHPGRHAETEALRKVPVELWHLSRRMTCYTTLEPCLMCFGALLLHGIGRIVFGAEDKLGGAKAILNHLPEYYADGVGVPKWTGPIMSAECDPLYERVKAKFEQLPCGRGGLKINAR